MSDVTLNLSLVESCERPAAEHLLQLVYEELRKLAKSRLAQEQPGQTLQATALVHEAYLRLVDVDQAQQWGSRGHFFAAAAQAMQRILVEQARRKGRIKHGADLVRQDFDDVDIAAPAEPAEIVAIDAALSKLAAANERAAQLVQLRYFAGLTIREAAEALNISPRKADQIWAYARAWLLAELAK